MRQDCQPYPGDAVMILDRKLLIGAAAIALLGAVLGFAVARATDPHSPAEAHDEHGEHGEGEAEEAHAEGFVALKPADAPAAGVELAHVERGGGADILLPGRIAPAANAQSTVGAPLDGTIVEMHVAAGSSVRRGSPIASIRSPDGAAARAELDSARAALDLAEAADRRDSSLFDQGAVSRQQWEATRAATLKAQADLRAAEAELAAMGSPSSAGIVVVRSPIAGAVMRISTAPGAVLDDGEEIAAIADASRTELVFDAPPASIGAIAVGAHIEGRGASGEVIEGEVTGVGPGVAGAGATVRARVIGRSPPPGTVISGRLAGGSGDVLTVPSDAVQTVEGRPVVFIAEAEGFRARPVIPGRVSSGRTEIIGGLEGDEQIAGTGAFLLKAELGKGDAEHGH
jgi:cobalt-zinc-cadmium efflux system membrane fusion protein